MAFLGLILFSLQFLEVLDSHYSLVPIYGDTEIKSTCYDRREILHKTAPHLVDSICAYRAGYIAEVCSLFI